MFRYNYRSSLFLLLNYSLILDSFYHLFIGLSIPIYTLYLNLFLLFYLLSYFLLFRNPRDPYPLDWILFLYLSLFEKENKLRTVFLFYGQDKVYSGVYPFIMPHILLVPEGSDLFRDFFKGVDYKYPVSVGKTKL